MVWSARRVLVALAPVAVLMLAWFIFTLPKGADAAINQQINFQGKLTNPDGTNVTDGNYSLRFRIYTGASGDTGAEDFGSWARGCAHI